MSHKDTTLSFSSLSRFAESPLSFIDYKTAKREPTPPMILGTLVHRRVLEPAEYERTVHVFHGRRAGATWREFQHDHSEGDIITEAESAKIEAIADSINSQLQAVTILQNCTDFEMPIEWQRDGIAHRGYIDGRGPGFVVDLKITVNTAVKDLQRMIYDRRYFMQAAMYADGLRALGYDVTDAYIIAVQSQRPHHVRCLHLPTHYLVRGHHEWTRLLDLWKAWDGVPSHSHDTDDITEIDAPPWAPIPEGMKGDKRTK